MPATPEPELIGPGRWRMWAVQVPSPPHAEKFYEPGHYNYAKAFGANDHPVVEVLVTENDKGPYWGWLPKDRDIPIMIHATEGGLFRMCFPYGPQAEEERGKGRILRLNIELLEA